MNAFKVCFRLGIAAGLASLVGCGSAQLPFGSRGGAAPANRTAGPPPPNAYKVLYSFQGPPDGEQPTAPLIYYRGLFYGTTSLGGESGSGCNSCGTVFWLSTGGTENVLHKFGSGTDGAYPQAGLTVLNGTFFGTTYSGGAACSGACGVVFKIKPDGTEKVIYSFLGGSDGANPHGGLLAEHGTLFGTTEAGGGGLGTVFAVTTYGSEAVLHRFTGEPYDGAVPVGNLVESNGVTYGVTQEGGTYNVGTVFALTASGGERIVHSFNATEGKYPVGLMVLKGKLYGALSAAGRMNRGAIFSLTPGGKFRVIHSFRGTPNGDGAYPFAPPIAVDDVLYGTTKGGGGNGNGTVYAMSTSGSEIGLHSFGHPPDGIHPYAPLLYHNQKLYGTTVNGGGGPAYGTLYRVAP